MGARYHLRVLNDAYARAVASRDPRFDGVFFVGITTTGVYCRPLCPAPPARRERQRYFATAAEAEHDGFRACFRCRPELAPGHASVDAVPRLVDRAVRRIEEGALNEDSVEALAGELGVTGRHLRRAMVGQLGVTPVELAQTVRLAFAKRLLQDASISVSELAFASGFQSLRRFNAAFRARFGRPPSALRKRAAGAPGLRLRLDFRPPLAWSALLSFLGQRAIPGVEAVADGVYRRSVEIDGKRGWLEVRQASAWSLEAMVDTALLGAVMPLTAKLRALSSTSMRNRRTSTPRCADTRRSAAKSGARPVCECPAHSTASRWRFARSSASK